MVVFVESIYNFIINLFKKNNDKKYLYNSIYFLFCFIYFATYLSYIGGYGSDEDTLL